MNTKSQVDFDCLLQLHMSDKTEEDNDMSWESCKVSDYLVEWNDVNKTKSCVNLFALSLSNPKTISSFEGTITFYIRCPFVTSPNTVGQTWQ
jgi:hypothetical protein